jgi:hypothetical protein
MRLSESLAITDRLILLSEMRTFTDREQCINPRKTFTVRKKPSCQKIIHTLKIVK